MQLINKSPIDLGTLHLNTCSINNFWNSYLGEFVTFYLADNDMKYYGIVEQGEFDFKQNVVHIAYSHIDLIETRIIYHNPLGPATSGGIYTPNHEYYLYGEQFKNEEELKKAVQQLNFNKEFLENL